MTGIKLTMMRSPRWPGLVPHDTVSEDIFFALPTSKPMLVTLTQHRNIEHFQKFWVLARKVADFHDGFLDEKDAVRFAKRRLGMFKSFHEKDGTIWCEYESIAVEKMDQLAFREFYDKCLDLWAAEIGCDPEELLK